MSWSQSSASWVRWLSALAGSLDPRSAPRLFRLFLSAWLATGSLMDRCASPWDDPCRRPSHADKRRACRRELLGAEIRQALRDGFSGEDFAAPAERLLDLAA